MRFQCKGCLVKHSSQTGAISCRLSHALYLRVVSSRRIDKMSVGEVTRIHQEYDKFHMLLTRDSRVKVDLKFAALRTS